MIPFEEIKKLLEDNNLEFQVSEHKATPTSEDSARVRGSSIESGVKALVVKAKDKYLICAISAAKRLDPKKLQKLINKKKSRFATPDEPLKLTGLKPGSIPPFGMIFNLPTLVDHSVKEQETINFNAGDLCKSISMKSKDYISLFGNQTHDISK